MAKIHIDQATYENQIIVANRYHGAKGTDITHGTWLGNPFAIDVNTTREQAIEKYRVWLRNEFKLKRSPYQKLMELVMRVKSGETVVLLCCCAPKPCHGDVIKDAILKIIESEELKNA